MDLRRLFETEGFVPRSHCGGWDDALIWASWVADALYMTAYLAIPLGLIWVAVRARNPLAGRPWVLFWAAAFVLMCGGGHGLNILVFRWPAYRFFVAWGLAGGVVSWGAGVAFLVWYRRLAEQPSVEELHAEKNRLQVEHADLLAMVHAMKKVARAQEACIDDLNHMRRTQVWVRETDDSIERMRRTLRETVALVRPIIERKSGEVPFGP